jgi:hypothetical protein
LTLGGCLWAEDFITPLDALLLLLFCTQDYYEKVAQHMYYKAKKTSKQWG